MKDQVPFMDLCYLPTYVRGSISYPVDMFRGDWSEADGHRVATVGRQSTNRDAPLDVLGWYSTCMLST